MNLFIFNQIGTVDLEFGCKPVNDVIGTRLMSFDPELKTERYVRNLRMIHSLKYHVNTYALI